MTSIAGPALPPPTHGERLEESVTVRDGLVFPVHLALVGVRFFGVCARVERVVSHHLERHRVSTRLADVVDVLHPDTRL
jgi:hypothetical protein